MISRRHHFANSSNVDWTAYDDEPRDLFIGYNSGNSYRAYVYHHVPAKIWCGLENAASSGCGRPQQNISLQNIERLATTLGVSLAELFAPFTDKPAPPS